MGSNLKIIGRERLLTSVHVAGIDFKTSTTVTKADVKGKTLTTDSGEEISYEKLIIALGSVVS